MLKAIYPPVRASGQDHIVDIIPDLTCVVILIPTSPLNEFDKLIANSKLEGHPALIKFCFMVIPTGSTAAQPCTTLSDCGAEPLYQ